MASSGYLDLLDLPIPNNLLKKLGFFTASFSLRCIQMESWHAGGDDVVDKKYVPQRDGLV